jgi:hypothetical protein
MKSFDRRGLLKTLAVGAGALPLAAPLGRGFLPRAHAAPGGMARIVFIDIPNGVPENAGGYADYAAPGASETDFRFGVLTASLEKLKQDVVVMDHMEMRNSVGNKLNTHAMGHAQMLTGYAQGEYQKGQPKPMSVDQVIATRVGRMVTPKFPSLVLSVQTDGSTPSYGATGSRMPVNQDPYDVYKKVFGDLTTGGSGMTDAALLERLARRKSVLDNVAQDLAAFRTRLSAEDRKRADAQLDSVRAMEARLSANATAGASCKAPTQMPGLNVRSDRVFPDLCRMQLDLVANAFACDLTRVVTIGFRNEDYQVYQCNFDPVNVPTQNFHGLSHNNTKDDFASFKKAKALVFSIVAEFAQKLKAIPEGTGSMLDNTIIFVGTEIGRGHTISGLHFLTIGGKNLGVRGGRYLRQPGTNREPSTGTPHNRLLVSFLNAMGIPDQTFNEGPTTGSGPLPGYLA